MIVIFLHKKTLIYAENMPFLLYFTIEKYECQELNLYLDYLAKGVPFDSDISFLQSYSLNRL